MTPRIIGVTGGSGSGKSTLSRILQERGFLFLDCDRIYHELLESDTAMLRAIARRFPEAMTGTTLERKKLGAIVFADPAALQDLNAITHEAVKRAVVAQLDAWQGPAVIDAIALFEGGLAQLCDVTVAVTAPEEIRVRRLMARDHIPEHYARSRIAAQKKDSWFASHCDYTLENDRDPQAFAGKCVDFLESFAIM